MYRFFVEESQIYDGTVHITGSDVNHIKNVLRMRPGEKILVSTGGEKEYHCAVSDFPEGEVLAAVEEVTAADRELPSGIVLFQGLPKGDKMELIIQKAVELGATETLRCEAGPEKGGKESRALADDRAWCCKAVQTDADSDGTHACYISAGACNDGRIRRPPDAV